MARRNRTDDPHAPFASDGVRLAFGRDGTGDIVHVARVLKEGGGEYVCPGCGGKVFARSGSHRPHFYHAVAPRKGKPNPACAAGQMTALHRFAQDILVKGRTLKLPAVGAGTGAERIERFPEHARTFDRAAMEQPVGSIRPDVVMWTGESVLHVEVYVTHACPPEKVDAVRAAGHAMIEIDLSKGGRDVTQPGLGDWILHEAPRYWIYNRHIEKIEAGIADAKREEADRRERQLSASAAELLATYRSAERAALADEPQADADLRRAEEGGWVGFISGFNALAPGLFTVHPNRWRSHVLISVLSGSHSQTVEQVLASLTVAQMTNNEMLRRLQDDVSVTFHAGLPVGGASVVEDYLKFIQRSGAVRERGDRWRRDPSVGRLLQAQVQREIERANEAEARQGRIDRFVKLMEAVRDGLPSPDRNDFETAEHAWRDAQLWGATPLAHAQVGGDHWTDLERALTAIITCMRDGTPDPAPGTLGLPLIDGAMQRGIDRRRVQIQAAVDAERVRRQQRAQELVRQADDRATTIRNEAWYRLLDEAEGWLATALPREIGLPEEAARRSPEGFEQAQYELDRAVSLRNRRLNAVRDLKAFAAQHILRVDHLDLMLKTGQPALNGISMLAYCRDDVTLQRCKDIIKPSKSRKR